MTPYAHKTLHLPTRSTQEELKHITGVDVNMKLQLDQQIRQAGS